MAFLEKIQLRNTTRQYYKMKFQASLHQAEISPLEDILGVPSEGETHFDADTDAAFEKRALQLLEERRKMRGDGR